MPPVLTSASVVGAERSPSCSTPPTREHARRAAAVLAWETVTSGDAPTKRSIGGSGARTWSIASTAAPTTPARSPDAAGDDAEVGGGQRQRPPVHDLAHAGEQRVAGLGSEPPMTMTLGLSRLTALASTSPIVRPASRTSRVADREPARARATTSRLDAAVDARSPPAGGDRGAAGDGLEAAHVAAPADRVDVVGDLDVAEVAGGALGAAAQRPVADDPAADPGRNLDEHQVVDVAGSR